MIIWNGKNKLAITVFVITEFHITEFNSLLVNLKGYRYLAVDTLASHTGWSFPEPVFRPD